MRESAYSFSDKVEHIECRLHEHIDRLFEVTDIVGIPCSGYRGQIVLAMKLRIEGIGRKHCDSCLSRVRRAGSLAQKFAAIVDLGIEAFE